MSSSRVIVVVPRQEPGLHEYLQRSLACLKDVEVVLDRRAVAVRPVDERRRQPPESSERKILLCSLVHCPAPPPPAAPEPQAADPDASHPRTLLWPALRIENL